MVMEYKWGFYRLKFDVASEGWKTGDLLELQEVHQPMGGGDSFPTFSLQGVRKSLPWSHVEHVSELDGLSKTVALFRLDDAVSGFSNQGIEYDHGKFTLGFQGVFENEHFAEKCIHETIVDYRKRGVLGNDRFIVLPVYHTEQDDIFKPQPPQ